MNDSFYIEENTIESVDYNIIQELINVSHKNAMERYGLKFTTTSFSYEQFANMIGKDGLIFNCVYKNLIVGTISLSFENIKNWAYTGKSGYIRFLAVLPEYQRKGVASKLIEATKLYAKSIGLEVLFLVTLWKNKPAIKLYEKNGFKVIRVFGKTKANANLAFWIKECPFSDKETYETIITNLIENQIELYNKNLKLKKRVEKKQKQD